MSLMKPLSLEIIDDIHRKAWEKAIEKYGNAHKVPREKASLISERGRALHILLTWHKRGESGSAARHMDKYGLQHGSQAWALKKFAQPDDAVRPEATKHRKDLYQQFERWASQHEAEQFTTAQLVEQSGFSTATILKYLKTSRSFFKIKRGLYEARNPNPSKKSKKTT